MPERPRPKLSNKKRARYRGRVLFAFIVLLVCSAYAYSYSKKLLPPIFVSNHSNPESEGDSSIIAIYCARSCVSVDTNGLAVKHAPRPNGNLILYIDNEFTESPHIGDKVVSSSILKELVYLRNEIRTEAGVHFMKASQSRLVAEDFDIQTNKGWRVRLSTANNAPATVKILLETLEQVTQKNQEIEYVDLRIENRVYLKTL